MQRIAPAQYFGELNYGENSYQVNGNYPNYFPWLIGGIIVALVAIVAIVYKK